MYIIPELEIVLILTPRTGSGSLRRAVAATHPRAKLLYRHMEADGVPQGYDRWAKYGVVREPVERLWSLYKFLRTFSGDHDPAYIEAMRRQADRPFEDWLLNNQTVFTSPYDSAGHGRFWPDFTVRHPLPENRKSQFVYLRPDLGTNIVHYGDLDQLAKLLEVELGHTNRTAEVGPPPLSDAAREYVERWFAWDLEAAVRR